MNTLLLQKQRSVGRWIYDVSGMSHIFLRNNTQDSIKHYNTTYKLIAKSAGGDPPRTRQFYFDPEMQFKLIRRAALSEIPSPRWTSGLDLPPGESEKVREMCWKIGSYELPIIITCFDMFDNTIFPSTLLRKLNGEAS